MAPQNNDGEAQEKTEVSFSARFVTLWPIFQTGRWTRRKDICKYVRMPSEESELEKGA
jgi:hypothetical protein